MSIKLDWVLSLQRIGVSFFTNGGILGTLQTLNEIKAGVNSNNVEQRLNKLEDPIGSIHIDVPSVAVVLYKALENNESIDLTLTERVFDKYRRSLTKLNAGGFIQFHNAAGTSYPLLITLNNPYFIMYSAALSNQNEGLNKVVAIIDSSEHGKWLKGEAISQETSLPVHLIKAIFDIWESEGLGVCSKTLGAYEYQVEA